jgi:hypothetical protein
MAELGWVRKDAATEGAEPDDDAMLELHERMNKVLLGIHHELVPEWEREDALTKKLVDCVADAHKIIEDAATLGRGTCHIECFDDGVDEGLDGEWFSYTETTWYLSCSHTSQGTEPPKFCPECGRMVVPKNVL